MSEDSESEMCPVCDEWCGKERAADLGKWLFDIIMELKALRAYKDENEKTLANYRAIAQKFNLPPISGGRMIGDTSDE